MASNKITRFPSSAQTTEADKTPKNDSKVKVGVVQASPVILDREATLEKVAKITSEYGCNGAGLELLLFPEAFISWYPRGNFADYIFCAKSPCNGLFYCVCEGNNFGVVIGSRTQEGREMFQKYWESSVTVPGNFLKIEIVSIHVHAFT